MSIQPLFDRLFSLRHQTALITGAAGGIGQVLATALAEAGATVALHDLTADRLAATQRSIAEAGGQAFAFAADLQEVAQCRQLIAEVDARLGRLDILVNCAAMNRRKPIAAVSPEDFDTIVAVNLRSIYFLSQAAQPLMQRQGGGKIIHIGSINSFYGLDTVSVYGLTKGALTQLTRVQAVEWARDNIQVNGIAPGFMDTPLSKPVWADKHRAAWLRSRIPVHRPGQPEELVGLLLLLAGPASSYISGQTFVVDGGFLAGGSWAEGE
jgi:gluconate 5-dehydrogenase